MRDMPQDPCLPAWAPTVEELDRMECDLGGEVWAAEDEPIEQDSACSSGESDMDELDPGLLERLDALEVADWSEPELDEDFLV